MADGSTIEWTDATWTPIRARNTVTGKIGWHCEHASPGCEHCYSETFNRDRLGTRLPFKPGHRADVEIFLDETMLLAPLRWRRPRKIFLGSMTDVFADFVPNWMLDRIFAVAALCPHHTVQVLTKRSSRMRAYFQSGRATPVGMEAMDITLDAHATDRRSRVGAGVKLKGDIAHLAVWPLPNVWLGVSAEDQQRYEERARDLQQTPAAVHFFSFEPLLGPIAVGYLGEWAIVGGESGPGARPMHPEWARDIRDHCAAAGVPFHFKQWGEFRPLGAIHDESDAFVDAIANADEHRSLILCSDGREWPDDAGQPPNDAWMVERVGKARAGRCLDGLLHDGMPGAGA